MSDHVPTMLALCAALCALAGARADNLPAELSPRLEWIRTEGFRAGYNYMAPLDWYPRASAVGMNAIISRMELANDPSGDEGIDDRFPGGAALPMSVAAWRHLQPSSRAAKENGLRFFFMLNLGSSMGNISDGYRDNPRRHNNGELFSPLDDIYWTRVVENRFLRAIEMLDGDEYRLDGLLIDPEMYSLRGAQPPGVDYGDFALAEFVRDTGEALEFQGLSIADRRRLIAERGLDQRLYDHQFERIRALAERTRVRVQERLPDAILGFFLWSDNVWYRAVAAGFSTPQVPCFVGPECTYPGAFDEEFLQRLDTIRAQAEAPILLVPGLRLGYEDGRLPAEYVKVIPGNLYHRSLASEGYWFWALSRLGGTDEERAPFLEALRTVNDELDRHAASGGAHVSALQPAPLPLERPAGLEELLAQAATWQPVPAEALPAQDPGPGGMGLRAQFATYPFVIRAEEGEDLRAQLRSVRLGAYTNPAVAALFRPDGTAVQLDGAPLGRQAQISVRADMAGMWVLATTAHNNALWILPETTSAVLAHPDHIALCKAPGPQGVNRFFFYVPKATERFSIDMRASAGESATFRVCNPQGEVAFERVRLDEGITQEFAVGPHAGRVWWLETSDAIEDHSFKLVDIPNLVAARADQLLVPEL